MISPLTPRKRTDPTLTENNHWWQSTIQAADAEESQRDAKPGKSLAHTAGKLLKLSIIAALLAVVIIDKKDTLQDLLQLSSVTDGSSDTANLKPASQFAKQKYFLLTQEIAHTKNMIKRAQKMIEVSNQEIEQYSFEKSTAESALEKLKREYDVRGLEE